MLKSNPNPATMQVMPFQFETHELRTLLINDAPYFVAKDICNVLGLQDTEVSLRKLDDDEKLMRKLYVSGQNREIALITESGLYALVMRSNKPEAKRFRKWVTSEVLPSIRKTGQYEIPELEPMVERPYVDPLSIAEKREVMAGVTAYVLPNDKHGWIMTTQEVARAYKATEKAIQKRRTNHRELFEENTDYIYAVIKNGQNHSIRTIFYTPSGFQKMGNSIQKSGLRSISKSHYTDLRALQVSTPSIREAKSTPQYSEDKAELIEFVVRIDDKEIRTQLFDKLKKLNLI